MKNSLFAFFALLVLCPQFAFSSPCLSQSQTIQRLFEGIPGHCFSGEGTDAGRYTKECYEKLKALPTTHVPNTDPYPEALSICGVAHDFSVRIRCASSVVNPLHEAVQCVRQVLGPEFRPASGGVDPVVTDLLRGTGDIK